MVNVAAAFPPLPADSASIQARGCGAGRIKTRGAPSPTCLTCPVMAVCHLRLPAGDVSLHAKSIMYNSPPNFSPSLSRSLSPSLSLSLSGMLDIEWVGRSRGERKGESEVVAYNKKQVRGRREGWELLHVGRGSEKDNVIDLTGTERDWMQGRDERRETGEVEGEGQSEEARNGGKKKCCQYLLFCPLWVEKRRRVLHCYATPHGKPESRLKWKGVDVKF